MLSCGGSDAKRLYNRLEGSYYRIYRCVLLSQDVRRQRLPLVQLLAIGVYNYLCITKACLYRGVLLLLMSLSAIAVERTAFIGRF